MTRSAGSAVRRLALYPSRVGPEVLTSVVERADNDSVVSEVSKDEVFKATSASPSSRSLQGHPLSRVDVEVAF